MVTDGGVTPREEKRVYVHLQERDGSIEGMVAITNVGLDD